jgi:GT2 family glycosyltransferase
MDVLRIVGSADLSIGRLYEGHVNALRCSTGMPRPSRRFASAGNWKTVRSTGSGRPSLSPASALNAVKLGTAVLLDAMADALAANDALICAQVRYLGPKDARGDWQEAELLGRSSEHPERRFPAHGIRQVENAGLFRSLVFGIHRERFFGLGGFDEAFTGYGAEDTDFGFRARKAGLPLLFMGGAGAFHQHHDSFEPPLQHLEDIVRNANVFRVRWDRWPMEGWLAAVQKLGLVSWDQFRLSVIVVPPMRKSPEPAA